MKVDSYTESPEKNIQVDKLFVHEENAKYSLRTMNQFPASLFSLLSFHGLVFPFPSGNIEEGIEEYS